MTTAQAEKIGVLVVDDHPVVRDGLRAMLEDHPEIEVVAEAGNGEEALNLADTIRPPVALVDIRMPGMNGIELTRELKEKHPQTAVIILTMYDTESYVRESLSAGAAGYLVKDSSRDLVCRAIIAAREGGALIKSQLLRDVVSTVQNGLRLAAGEHKKKGPADGLTARVLTVTRGSLRHEIAPRSACMILLDAE